MISEQLAYWFPRLTDNSPFMFAVLDQQCRFLHVNSRYSELSGLSNSALIGKTDLDVLGERYAAQLRPYYARALNGEPIETEIQLVTTQINSSFHINITPLYDDRSTKPTAIVVHGADTSERQVLSSALEEAEQQVRLLSSISSDGICLIEQGDLLRANLKAIQLLGIKDIAELKGRPLGRHLVNPQTRQLLEDKLDNLKPGDTLICQTSPNAQNQRLLEISRHPISLLGTPASIIKLVEANTVKAAQQENNFLHADPLTGLLNRHGFTQQLDKHLSKNNAVQLLYIDVDNFKNINDSLGHHIGDRVLKEIANRLQHIVPPQSVIGHIGGDEFGIVLTHPEHERSAQLLAQQVIEQINLPFDLLHFSKHLACSIGIVVSPLHGKDARQLMQNADTAMYEAKHNGRNRFACFDNQMSKDARMRLWLEIELQKALKNRGLEVWYQPKVDARTFTVCGAEALVRWRHPVEGYISPAQFIPVAERSGLIEQLGLVVMEEVFKAVHRWRQRNMLPGRIAINLSPQQFGNPNLIKHIRQLLQQEQVTPRDVTFELTESAVMSDGEHAIQMLNAMKQLGIALSIDDFGTGYSSLSYLTRFPLDELKIDRAFIKDLQNQPKQATLIECIIHLAKSMDLQIVAEGIETQDQATLLSNLQCDAIQGFHFYKPMPPQEFENILVTAAAERG